MEMRRRQTSYSSISSSDDYGCYESNLNLQGKFDQPYYADPESSPRTLHGMNARKKSKKKSWFGVLFSVVQLLALCLVSFYAYNSYTELKDTTSQLLMLNDEYTVLRETYSATESELAKASEIFRMVKSKMEAIYPDSFRNNGGGIEGNRLLFDSIIKRQDTQKVRISNLERSIQQFSLKHLKEKYGEGPYQIEVTLNMNGEKKWFTIETAPIHLVPHSILRFMELMESKMYNNIDLKATGHIIMTTLPDEVTANTSNHLIFPEYSPEFPHLENTVGFGTRPGGPDFYINTSDNSKPHGPGGQTQHVLVEEADSCFGKIVRGHDLLPRMMSGERATIEAIALIARKR